MEFKVCVWWSQVGKIVMEHAAKNLTPVTLELGGKRSDQATKSHNPLVTLASFYLSNSPVIIAEDADIKVAAQRIIWGKFLNAGQTCIAPDYVLCPPGKIDQFVKFCKQTATKYYGENPQLSSDFGRIINDRHFQYVLCLDIHIYRAVCCGCVHHFVELLLLNV